MLENPIHDLVLKCETLHLAHGVGILLISALQRYGIAVCTHHFVQPRIRATRIEHQIIAADDVVEQQTERDAAPRGLDQRLARRLIGRGRRGPVERLSASAWKLARKRLDNLRASA